jgi:hypothetical protein
VCQNDDFWQASRPLSWSSKGIKIVIIEAIEKKDRTSGGAVDSV